MARTHVPTEVEDRVRVTAKHRCGYCLSPQRLVMACLELVGIRQQIDEALALRRYTDLDCIENEASWQTPRPPRP